jgi:hypothetical protein
MTKSPFSILECPRLPNPTGFCASPKECLAKRLDNLIDHDRTCKAMRELRISNSSEREKALDRLNDFILQATVKIEDESEGNYYTRSSAWDDICKIISELRERER